MSYLYTNEACGLTQPRIVVATEMCFNAILRNVFIFLTVVIALLSIVVPIVVMSMAFGLCRLIYVHIGFDLHSKAL